MLAAQQMRAAGMRPGPDPKQKKSQLKMQNQKNRSNQNVNKWKNERMKMNYMNIKVQNRIRTEMKNRICDGSRDYREIRRSIGMNRRIEAE
jgi:hypothetical protein